MTTHSWLMFLVLVIIATSTPGPAVLFVTTNSILHGWRKSVFAALGNILGLLCLGIVAMAGLGTVIQASEPVFTAVKYMGSAYLIFLGIRQILAKKSDFSTTKDDSLQPAVSSKKIFIQAFAIALSNPKAILFLTALFPQFIDTGQPLVPQFTLLISTLMFFSFMFLLGYSLVACRARIWLSKPQRNLGVSKISGTIFVGFGLWLATSSNK